MKVQQIFEKGWCYESAASNNLNFKEIATGELPKKLKNLAHKRQVKHTSVVMEPSSPFHTLVKLVHAKNFAKGKICTLDQLLEINNVTSKLEAINLSA